MNLYIVTTGAAAVSERQTTLLIAAGGTGGHVFPALTVARQIAEHNVRIVWVGTTEGLEAEVIPKQDFLFVTITAARLRGGSLIALLLLPWRLSSAILKSLSLLIKYRPQLVLGMGGFVAGPVGLIASALGVPLIIHEQNAVMGVSNRLLARLSKRVLLGFADTIKLPNARYVGNPVAEEICTLSDPEARYRQRTDALRLLVIGGSQGAAVLNEVVPKALAMIEPVHRPQVRQQTGLKKLHTTREAAEASGVEMELFEFADDMASLYEWADLVICRAGAISVAELAAAGVASILVPYPHSADDHQTENARSLTDRDAGVLLPQDELSPNKLAALLEGFVNKREVLAEMAVRARRRARPDAGAEVARICLGELRV